MTINELIQAEWYKALPTYIRQLLFQAWYLVERETHFFEEGRVVDYGYLVFSAAKAYEGFLKDHFMTLGLIDLSTFGDEYFRIGRALNPDLPKRFRDEQWLYDDVERICGLSVAENLWHTWKECRNSVFHYTQDSVDRLSLEQARIRVLMVIEAIQSAQACEVAIHGLGKE